MGEDGEIPLHVTICRHVCILQNISDQHVGVSVCLTRGGIPLDDDGPSCRDDNRLLLNTTDLQNDLRVLPVPGAG